MNPLLAIVVLAEISVSCPATLPLVWHWDNIVSGKLLRYHVVNSTLMTSSPNSLLGPREGEQKANMYLCPNYDFHPNKMPICQVVFFWNRTLNLFLKTNKSAIVQKIF